MYGAALGGDDGQAWWMNMLAGGLASASQSIQDSLKPDVKPPVVKPPAGSAVASAAGYAWPIFLVGGLGVLALGTVAFLKFKK